MRNRRSHPSLQWLVETFGVDGAYAFITTHGYARLYVPSGEGETNKLLSVLDTDQLTALQDLWAGEYIKVPISRPFCCQYLSFVRDMSYGAIARELRMREDSVRKALSVDLGFPIRFTEAAKRWKAAQEALAMTAAHADQGDQVEDAPADEATS